MGGSHQNPTGEGGGGGLAPPDAPDMQYLPFFYFFRLEHLLKLKGLDDQNLHKNNFIK